MTDSGNRYPDKGSLRNLQSADLGLLTTLDALLTEVSVTGAARRLGASAPAVSRALARLRKSLGDPLLVRAGNRLVATPRALELQGPVRELVGRALALLTPEGVATPEQLARTFTIRSSEWFVEMFGAALVVEVGRRAPGAVLRFIPEGEEDVEALRSGAVDLDVGVIGHVAPEVVTCRLFDCRMYGAVRAGHALTEGPMTPGRYAGHEHVAVSRRGLARGPIDRALEGLGLERRVAAVVPSFAAARHLIARTDLVAALPRLATADAGDEGADGVCYFALPVETPPICVEAAWHPRSGNDATHRWLRGLVREICGGG